MESHAKYTLVGSIVILTFVVLIASVLWMTSNIGKEDTKKYIVYFHKQSLSGLQEDGMVTMKGIKIGTVLELAIHKEDIEKVRVVLEVKESSPIRQNTEALIQRNLLTGIAVIDLILSTNQSPPLETIPPGEEFPVIKENTSKIQIITDSLSDTMSAIKNAANAITVQSSRLGDEVKGAAQAISKSAEKLEDPAALLQGPSKSNLGPGEEKLLR